MSDRDYQDGAGYGYAQAEMESNERITSLESQLRDMEAMRDEAGRRYIAQVRECTDKQREVNRLRECLKRVEWIILPDVSGVDRLFCPACQRRKNRGHEEDCWISRALEGK